MTMQESQTDLVPTHEMSDDVIKRNPTMYTVLVAIFTALTTVTTIVLVVPFPSTFGYFNLGDTLVMLSGMILGPIGGFIAGGVGSAMGDVGLGYAYYAPITFIVKGCEGFVVGWFARYARGATKVKLADIVGLILGSIIMLYGYLVSETYFYGFEFALAEMIWVNLIQVTVGSIVAIIIAPTIRSYIQQNL
ncbi:MAG: ECF transporter S component [Candidatus Thorarchaeota archaeon]